MAKDIRDLTASSSLLSFLRYGGVLKTFSYEIVSKQSNRAIVLYRNGKHVGEYPFSVSGLDMAICDMNEQSYPITFKCRKEDK